MNMAYRFFLLLITGIIASNASAQRAVFSVRNPSTIERPNELVVLQRTQLEKLWGKKSSGHSIAVTTNGSLVANQLFDSNGDEQWDQLLFLASFKPKETKNFILQYTQAAMATPAITPLAHVRMMPLKNDSSFGKNVSFATMPYQQPPTDFSKQPLPLFLTEGPGWENDKVAFRLYFDTRNTKDIYGKRIPGMVLDTVGANPVSSYHNFSGWGMDILHVAKSLGAGSLAIQTRENGKDTLIRLGGNNILNETYTQLADGPLYAAFRMTYQWMISDKPVTVSEDISIWGGQYFYESKVTVWGAPTGARLVIGIADFYENVADSIRVNNAAVLLSHGRQSENKDELGMAIVVSHTPATIFSEAPTSASDVMDTHLVSQLITEGIPLRFRFYACWSKTNEQFTSLNTFTKYMEREATRFSEPLVLPDTYKK